MVIRVLIGVVCFGALLAILPVVIVSAVAAESHPLADSSTISLLRLIPFIAVVGGLAGIGLVIVARRRRDGEL